MAITRRLRYDNGANQPQEAMTEYASMQLKALSAVTDARRRNG